MTIFEILKDLQENVLDKTTSWVLVWDDRPHFKRWICGLIDFSHCLPCVVGFYPPLKMFADANPKECVRQAWENEIRGEVKFDSPWKAFVAHLNQNSYKAWATKIWQVGFYGWLYAENYDVGNLTLEEFHTAWAKYDEFSWNYEEY